MFKTYFTELPVYKFENLSRFENIEHFVTSREGGFSRGEYASFNLGFGSGEDNDTVMRNRGLLTGSLGIAANALIVSRQHHTGRVRVIERIPENEITAESMSSLKIADAMITHISGACLTVIVADCVPILLYDPVQRIVGAVHAGWRGTVARVAEATVKKMTAHYGSKPNDIVAGIGPSIGPGRYEVGPDVIRAVEENLESARDLLRPVPDTDKAFLNLWEANRRQLIAAGLHDDNIEISGICTYDNHDRFYSYRHDRGRTGRFAAGIMVR